MDYEKTRLTKYITTVEIDTTRKFDQLNLDFLFEYRILPDNIMAFENQWKDEKNEMGIGDTNAQEVYIPPTKTYSLKMVFGL